MAKIGGMEAQQGAVAQQIAVLHEIVMGMAKTQQSLAVLCFMMAEETLSMGKPQIAKMVAEEIQESVDGPLSPAGGGNPTGNG